MTERVKTPARSNFKKFFLRGLAILLPSVLTIWILIAAYNFVQVNIAAPINEGVKELVVRFVPWWPYVEEQDKIDHVKLVKENEPARYTTWQKSDGYDALVRRSTKRALLEAEWKKYRVLLDLIGLFIAAVLIYIVGALLGSFIGRRLYHRGEELLGKVPLIRQVYPSVKQVTDFLVGDDSKRKFQFNQVVAVEYPRKGLWSVGLVTGDTMKLIQEQARDHCLTVFIPSSPTPFTGYVITVPKKDTIDLPISIEQALRFTVSGGVIIPPAQKLDGVDPDGPEANVADASVATIKEAS